MSDKNQPGRLLSIKAACELLGGVSESSIRLWLRQGKLTRVKVQRRTMLYEREVLDFVRPQWRAQK